MSYYWTNLISNDPRMVTILYLFYLYLLNLLLWPDKTKHQYVSVWHKIIFPVFFFLLDLQQQKNLWKERALVCSKILIIEVFEREKSIFKNRAIYICLPFISFCIYIYLFLSLILQNNHNTVFPYKREGMQVKLFKV